MVIGMSNKTENNSGPGGLVNPLLIGGENRSPIATGAAFSHKKSRVGIIYKVTNLVNGKIYIGKTITGLKQRISVHLWDARHKRKIYALHGAINKYGEENFKWEIMDRCLFPDMLCELEKKYIRELNCKAPNGYNLTEGGEGMVGYVASEETRKKMSAIHLGRPCSEKMKEILRVKMGKENHPFWGTHPSEETRKKLVDNLKNNPNAGMKGKHHSQETKEKIRLMKLGEKNSFFGKHHSEETKNKMRGPHGPHAVKVEGK